MPHHNISDREAPDDVALLVDWENLKFSLLQRDRQVNVTALREAAERFGRVVYARAYADWQDPVHSGDPAHLYLAGLEPVYVLTKRYTDTSGELRIKNSVDVKLAADCIEASHQFPNISTYVIVSGDHGFVHIVNTLRPHGKRIVVIGVSWTTAAQLTDQADVVLYYDIDVDSPLGEVSPAAVAAPETTNIGPAVMQAATEASQVIRSQGNGCEVDDRKMAETLSLCLNIIEEHRSSGRDITVSILGQELQKRMSGSDFQRLARGKSRIFAEALAKKNLIRLRQRNFVDWISLPGEPEEQGPDQTPALELPHYDYTGFVYSDLGEEERTRLLSAISEERAKPGTDFLTFNRVREVVGRITGKDEHLAKNLVNNMVAVTILKFDGHRTGRDPDTGVPYEFNTLALDYQHPDVRAALRLESEATRT